MQFSDAGLAMLCPGVTVAGREAIVAGIAVKVARTGAIVAIRGTAVVGAGALAGDAQPANSNTTINKLINGSTLGCIVFSPWFISEPLFHFTKSKGGLPLIPLSCLTLDAKQIDDQR
jgi:hypothetical protein